MVNGNCAVYGCRNSRYRIKVWEKKSCEEHIGQTNKLCPCPPPFRLFKFPSTQRNLESRKQWIKVIKRTTYRNTNWKPGQSDMVCSKHFVDGIPTTENPYPSLNMGYDKLPASTRRKLIRMEATEDAIDSDESLSGMECGDSHILNDHCYTLTGDTCAACCDKHSVISSLARRKEELSNENSKLKLELTFLCEEMKLLKITAHSRKPFSFTSISNDRQVRFFTGIQKISVFNALHSVLKPFIPKLTYWRGSNQVHSSKVRKGMKTNFSKITSRDQFLLVLMRLRLGLLTHDLAERFQVSEGTISSIFATWVRFLGKILHDALVVWLPKETILSNMPSMFHSRHKKTRCIIDYTEIFIERPKSLDAQATTWSNYKKHNTFKFLIGISPTGYIMFVSDCYGGRATDQFICQDSGFYNNLEYGDEIMADRGFQIQEDLLHHYCTLSVPPGARVKSQMTKLECKKTKEIANLRIHVERAINRMKTFRILKNIFPLTLLPLADDIVRSCAAHCNIQPPLLKE